VTGSRYAVNSSQRSLMNFAKRSTTATFTPGPTLNTLRTADGKILNVPVDWMLLPLGDAALTRRVKAVGDHWVVQGKQAERFSPGAFGHSKECIGVHHSLRGSTLQKPSRFQSTVVFGNWRQMYSLRRLGPQSRPSSTSIAIKSLLGSQLL
jgi:hypothetical protein